MCQKVPMNVQSKWMRLEKSTTPFPTREPPWTGNALRGYYYYYKKQEDTQQSVFERKAQWEVSCGQGDRRKRDTDESVSSG